MKIKNVTTATTVKNNCTITL